MKKQVTAGVVGAGIISEIYLKNMTTLFPHLRVKAVSAVHADHAKARAEQFGISWCTTDELLSDPEIDLIVNLTPLGAHYGIIKAALEAGKHVYTEKTLTDDLTKAEELLTLAEKKGLVLAGAPDTFLGSGVQTARSALDQGLIGRVTGFSVTANRDWGFLMNLFSFLREKGPGMCYDYGVYHVTALVSLLGPVASLGAFTTNPRPFTWILPDSPNYGQELLCPNETGVSATLMMASGVTGTLMLEGEGIPDERTLFRIYGTNGTLDLGDPNQFDFPVRVLQRGSLGKPGEFVTLDPVNPYSGNSRGVGVAEMADALLTDRESRVDAHLAYHVMEVLSGILKSSQDRCFVDIQSRTSLPEAFSSTDIHF